MFAHRSLRCVRAFVLLAIAFALPLAADDVQDRRAQTGVRLFRTLLAADLDLPKKTVGPNQLLIVFFYVDDRQRAADLAARFAGDAKAPEKIRDLDVVIELSNDPTLAAHAKRVPAGVFIAQPPKQDALKSLVRYGIQRRVIVYSPYEGHVESGVLGGLSIEAQVRPFINLATLEASHISLKEFFLKVTKVYR